MKLGVYGHGPQSKRYLDPKNWPDGVEVVQLERGEWPWKRFSDSHLDGLIMANAPTFHGMLPLGEDGKVPTAVLCEKPIGLAADAAEKMIFRCRKLLVAHTHLWAADFLRLPKSPSATVQWRGPDREDGSCPAILDWGPHAWSMALALGTERVSTGKGDRRHNLVRSMDTAYSPDTPRDAEHAAELSRLGINPLDTPMRSMLATFASLIDGGYDWRAEPDFALEVHRRCFKPSG